MTPSKVRNSLKAKINRFGTAYSSGDDPAFKGFLNKSDVGRDLARSEYTMTIGHDTIINDGEIITDVKNNQRYVPLMVEYPNLANRNANKKIYLNQANASGTIKSRVESAVASHDVWDEAPSAEENTLWGWVNKKTSVWVNFENYTLESKISPIGAMEKAIFSVYVPWSVNASHTPKAEDRFTTQAGVDWKIEDVDSHTFIGQAYKLRVSPDER